jgi:hypothetical protein
MYLLRYIPTAIAILATLTCFSQIDEERANVYDYKETVLSIPAREQKEKFPFSNIYVYDVRYDTSCLGVNARANGQRLNLVVLKHNLATEARSYYLSLLDSAASGSDNPEIHCFIKKLILSDRIDADKVKLSEEQRMVVSKLEESEVSGIIYTAEFYYKQDESYIPVCRFDSTLIGFSHVGKGGDYLADALTASLRRAYSSFTEKTKSGKRLTREAIDAYNNERFNISALTVSPAKGVYLSFKELLNNTPAYTQYTVEKNLTGDFLYVKNAKGQDEVLRDIWGYCDGKDYYIFSANNYFKLYRTGNGFKLYGAKDFTARRNYKLLDGPSAIDPYGPYSNSAKSHSRNRYYLVKDYFLLDMETGELF